MAEDRLFNEEPNQTATFLFVSDLQKMFHCGASKARLMMQELPSIRIGNSNAVLESDLMAYLSEHGGIKVKWSRKRKR